jgi:subfamily B ATP-binding cassette protein MsbA
MNTSYLLKRLVSNHVKPYLGKIGIAVFCMVVTALTSTLNVWLIQPALDKIFFNKDKLMLLYLPGIIILVSVVKGFADYYQKYLIRFVGQRVISDMQIKLYEHLVYADLAFINQHSSGSIISRFTNDIAIMRASVSNALTGIVKELLTVIFLVCLMFYQNLVLSSIAFIVFPVAILPMIKMGKRMRRVSNKMQEELGKYTAKLDSTFYAIKMIKSYRREIFEITRAKQMVEGIFLLYRKAMRIDALSSPMMEMLSGIATATVIAYGGMQVINGHTTPGGFFSFIVAFIAAYKPLKSLSDLNNNLQDGLAAAERVFKLLDTKPAVINSINASDLKISSADVEFTDVVFNYDDGKQALNNVSFKVKGGTTIALVGKSGAGKSTIVNLLLRFYDPNSGHIAIDNQNIKHVTIESLRDNIAIVSQDVMLFDDSIMNNIRYGRLDATDDEVIEAARAAAIDEFVYNMPDGYSSIIGENGHKLSGGQKQRISIARAILKNSPILILDEATSSLDNISERHIREAIIKLSKQRTTIIIAHRLSTITHADMIYVLKEGQIVEQGSHDKLYNKGKEYSRLYNAE